MGAEGGAKSHGTYWVNGADHDMMQGLAKTLQDDLVTKMRAAGYTVLTYDDIKSDPDVASLSADKIDSRYGLPSSGGLGMPVTFVDASPRDAQTFSTPIQGPAWSFRGIAKAKNLTFIVPELTFTTPQMFSQPRATRGRTRRLRHDARQDRIQRRHSPRGFGAQRSHRRAGEERPPVT